MARLIDADALKEHLSNRYMTEIFPDWWELPLDTREKIGLLGSTFKQAIENAHTIDAEPVRHGKNVSPAHYSDEFTCSVCGFSCEITELRYDDEDGFGMGAATAHEYDCKFCPNCGAKMDGGAEDG